MSKKKPVVLDPEAIALKIVSEMGHDNNVVYQPESSPWVALVKGVEEMINAGWEGGAYDISLMAYGEETERDEKFNLVPGWPETNKALVEIFDGPFEAMHRR
jgi:hypothetical protein